jgi:DNA-damage-inducible protein J
MGNTVNVTIRMDRDVKRMFDALLAELGMSMSTAVNVFARQTLRHGKIPFEIGDPFYSEKNQEELRRRIADVEAGCNLTCHDLIEVEDE